MKLENGIVKLSGFCETTFYVGWNNEEPMRRMLYLANPVTKEVILEAGTVWYESYYPIGRCYFNPTAMPINKQSQAETQSGM